MTRTRVALTGFMGVGKSTVAKHLASIVGCERADIDNEITETTRRDVAEIINTDGIEFFRRVETETLTRVLGSSARVIALGGGVWTMPENRELIRSSGVTSIWLETSFEHCWVNIVNSHRVRPLAKNRAETLRLFEERRRVYCLADWHFIIRPGRTSYDVARQIAEEVFSVNFD